MEDAEEQEKKKEVNASQGEAPMLEENPKISMDLEFTSCLLQPPIAHHDPNYVALRRLLLRRKALSSPDAISRRKVFFDHHLFL